MSFKFLRICFAVFACLILTAKVANAIDYPDHKSVYVNDFAEILNDADEEKIASTLQSLRENNDVEFTVVTIDSLQDYDHYGGIEPYATRLFNHWGVGNAERNDGVMFLIAVGDRKLRIEVGSGYGRTLDQPLKLLINSEIVPEFKNGDFAYGIMKGVDGTIDILGLPHVPITNASDDRASSSNRRQSNPDVVLYIFLSFFMFVFISVFSLVAYLNGAFGYMGYLWKKAWRNLAPRCQYCSGKTRAASGDETREVLTDGQELELQLGSTDYKVWICKDCGESTTKSIRKPRTRFHECPDCHYSTVYTTTEIIEKATRKKKGTKELHDTCENCGYEHVSTKSIPIYSSSGSSSSSSSSSSFGGGSSSGGGASGSW